MLSGMPSSAIRSNSSVRISASARGALGGGERLEVQPVEQLPVDVRLQLEVLRPRRARARRAGGRRPSAWLDVERNSSWLDSRLEEAEERALPFRLGLHLLTAGRGAAG